MCPNRQETADLVTFTELIFNGKLHFLCCLTEIFDNIVTGYDNHEMM